MTAISLAAVLGVVWLNVFWHFLGVILAILSILLTIVILIQDSKGAGLTSAFGAGPGGESLLGARMQKDVARWTIYLSTVFTAIVIAMGLMGTYSYRYGTAATAGAKPATTKAEAPALPGPPGAGSETTVPPAGASTPGSKAEAPGPVPAATSSAPATGGAAAAVPVAPAPTATPAPAPATPTPAAPAVPSSTPAATAEGSGSGTEGPK